MKNTRLFLRIWKASLVLGIVVGLTISIQLTTVVQAIEPGAGKVVQPMDTGRPDQAIIYNIIQAGLEKLGYKVKPALTGAYSIVHLSVAQGDADYTPVHWEDLHKDYYEKSGGDEKLVRLGPMYTGAMQAYFIDKKTADKYGITKLEQFKSPEIKKLFDSDGDGKANMTACDPGWGCERTINHHMKVYKMEDHIQQDKGQYFAIMANTIARFKEGKPVFFYAWTPAWMLSVLKPDVDVVWIEVPFTSLPEEHTHQDTTLADGRNPGFKAETSYVLANRKFSQENPVATKFLSSVKIPISDLNATAFKIHKGEKTPEHIKRFAEEWIKKNQAAFDSWLDKARKAAK
jgi:glycine betaine/proline transport system substrate-binding protein